MTAPQEGTPPPQQEGTPEESLAVQVKVAQAKLDSLQQRNNAELENLGGMGVQLDPSAINTIRLNAFVDFVFARLNSSQDVRQLLSLQFEVDYQEKMTETIKTIRSEVRKAMLGSGGQASEQQLRQMWQRSQNGHLPPGFGGN